MIQSYIDSIRNRGMILKFERFSHLSDQSFGFGSSIRFVVPIIGAFIESQCVAGNGYLEEGYLVPERGSKVKAIQSVSCLRTSDFSWGGQ